MLEPVPVDVGKVATPQQKVSHGSIGVTDCSAPTTAKDSEEDLEMGSPVANDGYHLVDLTFDTQLEDRQPEQDSPASLFKLELPDDADDDLTPTQVSSSKHLPSPPPRVEQSVEKQNNGTMNVQPMIPEAEPFQGLDSEWDEIPDILDDLAPKFRPGQAQLPQKLSGPVPEESFKSGLMVPRKSPMKSGMTGIQRVRKGRSWRRFSKGVDMIPIPGTTTFFCCCCFLRSMFHKKR